MQNSEMVQKLERLSEGEQKPRNRNTWSCFEVETDDMRESPSIIIIKELLNRGANIVGHDPQAMEDAKTIFGDSIEYADSE